jgi:large subunit ribosomal protein L29
MATKQLTKMRGKSDEELLREEQELRAEIWKLRLQLTTGQHQDPYRVRMARKNLARVMTIRRERELGARAGGK